MIERDVVQGRQYHIGCAPGECQAAGSRYMNAFAVTKSREGRPSIR